MRRAQPIALWLIAVLLGVTFVSDHVRPAVSLALGQHDYLAASRACHEARFYFQEVQAVAGQVDDAMAAALHRSAAVSMMDCHPRDVLREELLAAGVSEHALARIDDEGRLLSEAGLAYVAATAGP